MGKFDELVPDHIRRLGGYVAGKSLQQAERESGLPCIKMASNENPLGPSPRALEAMYTAASSSHFYPDNEASELRAIIAEQTGMTPEQVLITAGSTQFLNVIAHSLLAPGLNAVTSARSFIVYPMATQAAGGTLKQLPMHGDSFDLDALFEAIDQNTRVVFIANPNNPTGTMLDPRAVAQFVERVPSHVLVVLDEAYYEFAEYFSYLRGRDYSHSLELVRQERNVVVLRTFSKAQGLAGLRVGYGFGPAELINYFGRERTAFSISNVAEAAAIAALRDEAHIRRTLANNASGSAVLTRNLSDLGLRVIPTWTNFLYVDLGTDAAAIAGQMQAEGVIVRPLNGLWGAPTAIRITIGTPEQNERCIAALRHALDHVFQSADRRVA